VIFCEYFTTGKYTKKSNFVEDKFKNQGEIIQSDMNDTQKRTRLKCNMCITGNWLIQTNNKHSKTQGRAVIPWVLLD